MRRPSVVRSISSCGRKLFSTGLVSMTFSRRFFRFSRRCCSRRSASPMGWASTRLPWPRRTSPSLRNGSWPPPGTALVSAELLGPPVMATRNGMRKYSAMPLSSSRGTTLISHMTRKNAIIAVMKSA
ncbi:hypothetical protein FQZ97_1005650 [compost metagenome]